MGVYALLTGPTLTDRNLIDMLCSNCSTPIHHIKLPDRGQLSISRANSSHQIIIREKLLAKLHWVVGNFYDIYFSEGRLFISPSFDKGGNKLHPLKSFATGRITSARLLMGVGRFPDWFRYELALSVIPDEYYQVLTIDKKLVIHLERAVKNGIIKALPAGFQKKERRRD